MKKVIALVLLPILALVCVGFSGCACGGEAGGKVAGNVSASDQVYPWAGPSSTPAK